MFAFIAFLVIFLMNYYIYRGFILLLELPPFWIRFLSYVVFGMFVLEIAFLLSFRFNSLPTWIYVFMASLLGISFMVFSFTLIYDIFFVSVQKLSFSDDRRVFLKKILTFSSFALLFLYALRGFWGGLKKPRVRSLHVKIDGLKNELNLVQISDAHVGNFLGKEYLRYLVKKTNELKPDMVMITGDLVDWELDSIKEDLRELENLKSTYGTFFVAGNHEYYHGVEKILEYLQSLHVNVLRNENVTIGGVNIAGIYDLAAYRLNHPYKPDVQKSIKHRDKNLPTILLAHQPKIVETFSDSTPIDLVLSGHTHGGQIFPFGLLVRLAQPYLHGLYQHNKKTQIYVSSGSGFWGPPIRFLAPSEIVNIKLVPKKV